MTIITYIRILSKISLQKKPVNLNGVVNVC
jgi:hypothetical protein